MDSEAKFKVKLIVAETEKEIERKYEQWLSDNLSVAIIEHSISANPLKRGQRIQFVISLAIFYCDNKDALNTVLTEDDLNISRAFIKIEKAFIEKALKKAGGNKTRAAKILGISGRALWYKMKDYGISFKLGEKDSEAT